MAPAARPLGGNAVVYDSQAATYAKGFISASALLRYIYPILFARPLSEASRRFRLEGSPMVSRHV